MERTGLVGGKRVPKDSPRIQAYGTIGRLNAVVGLVRTFTRSGLRGRASPVARRSAPGHPDELFDLGSELATPPEPITKGCSRWREAQVVALEHRGSLPERPEPAQVVHAAGPAAAINAFLHLARTGVPAGRARAARGLAAEPIASGRSSTQPPQRPVLLRPRALGSQSLGEKGIPLGARSREPPPPATAQLALASRPGLAIRCDWSRALKVFEEGRRWNSWSSSRQPPACARERQSLGVHGRLLQLEAGTHLIALEPPRTLIHSCRRSSSRARRARAQARDVRSAVRLAS